MKKIKLTQGKYAMVDNEDFEMLNKWKWFAYKNPPDRIFYAIGKPKKLQGKQYFYMHRYLMQPPKEYDIDHKNRNGLDNRKNNLRICTKTQNQGNRLLGKDNTSGFKGVSFHKASNKFSAYIRMNNKRKWLGLFNDKLKAAKVYNQAAKQYFGEFSLLNKV